MKFKYTERGPVDVPGVGADIERGYEVEATGDLAKSLEAQPDWQKVAAPKPRKKAAAKKAAAAPKPPAVLADKTEE